MGAPVTGCLSGHLDFHYPDTAYFDFDSAGYPDFGDIRPDIRDNPRRVDTRKEL